MKTFALNYANSIEIEADKKTYHKREMGYLPKP